MSNKQPVSVAEFKRDFQRFASEVQRGGEVLVTRHGKPVGRFVPEVGFAINQLPAARIPGGLMAVLALFDEWDTMDQDMTAIVAARRKARSRPVPSLE
jgi:prevent-host-death family protein